MSSPIIWFGQKAKNLKNALQLSDQATISSGASDPSAVALAGAAGDIYLSTSTFSMYTKQDAGLTTNWLKSATLSSLTQGSVPFADALGNLAQDNTKFFWDESTKRLGIGTNTPTQALDVVGNGAFTGTLSASNVSGSTSGTNTGDVAIGTFGAVPNSDGASISGQTLTMQPADASHPGSLTSADWTTFNSKEPAISSGTSTQYWRGDKSFQPLNTAATAISDAAIGIDIDNLQDQLNHALSAGITSGGNLTDNGNGTVNIATSTGAILRTAYAVTSLTRASNIATVVTSLNHGFNAGEYVFIQGALQSQYNGQFYITSVLSPTSFTYLVSGSPATPATGSITTIDDHDTLNYVTIPAATNLALTDHVVNYIYADWNSGSPQYFTTTDVTIIAGLSRVRVWTVAREGALLWPIDNRATNVDTANKIDRYLHDTQTFKVDQGTVILSESGTRNIAVTQGEIWYGLNEIFCPAFDTSVSSTFTTAYTPDTGSTWTYTTGQTQISNTQYNNVASGLASITAGNYGVFWIYVMNNDPSTLMVLYGQGDYNKSQAFSSFEPTIKPAIITGVGLLIGRIIIAQGASSFTNVTSSFIEQFTNPSPDLNSLSDVATPSPNLNDVLSWNGAAWVNTPASAVSAGAGVNFYNTTPVVEAVTTNNANILLTLSQSPVTIAEQTIATPVNNTTLLNSAWTLGTPLGRTVLDAGTWDFTIYAGVSNTGAVRTITKNIYQIIPGSTGSYTLTTTGTGTSRTATVSGASFLAGDASATITVGGYLQSPAGLFKITAFTSSTVVTITTLTTYVNETGVQFSNWRNLFGGTTANITNISPAYAPATILSTQASFPIAVTDTIGTVLFVTSNNNTTITTVYNGTQHNSFFNTPLSVLHSQLAGLQGGVSNQYYHLTQSEYAGTGVGTGNVARLTSPIFTTPNIGNATGNISGNAATATTATTAATATNVATIATNSTAATFFPTFVASSTGSSQTVDTATGLTFNPSTNTLTTTTFSGALTGTASGNLLKEVGDIEQTSFSAANNQVAAADVTGLLFANTIVRSFDAVVSVYVNATSSLYEQFRLSGIQRGADWKMSATSVGDSSGFVFSITNAGQVQYTDSNYTGFTAATLKFRARTTSV